MGRGMEIDGCGKCMKYSLYLANFLIFIGGIVVLGIGIWTIVDKAFMQVVIGTNLYVSAAWIFTATGSIVILISFLGCFGAIKEIKCMLLSYFLLLFLVFIVMLVGGILGYVFRGKVTDAMKTEMLLVMKSYNYDDKGIRYSWDMIQKELKCCGVEGEEGYKDWASENAMFRDEYLKVPSSCCKSDANGEPFDCVKNPDNSAITYHRGCLEATSTYVKDHAFLIGGFGIGIACLMILGILFSCALFKMIE